MPTTLRRLAVPALLALALVPAACGEDEEEPASPSVATPGAAVTAEPAETPGAPPEADLKDTETKPVIAKPEGDPPTKLVKEDIVKGKGAKARSGKTVSVQYVGVSFSTGAEFDASWDRGQPFSFELGAGQVIQGWDKGVAGMRVGGRRKLVIPPDQGYGAAGSPPAIAPNETLVFVVDLLDVE